MIVYQAIKERFLHDNDHAQIEDEVQRAFVKKVGRYVSQGEFRSWRHSLAAMARVLRDRDIPDDIGVGIEFGIAQTAKRIDFVISGASNDDRPHLVIVELKQWSNSRISEKDGIIIANRGGKARIPATRPGRTPRC